MSEQQQEQAQVVVINWKITLRVYRHAFDLLEEQTLYGPLPDPRQMLEEMLQRWPSAIRIQIEMEKDDEQRGSLAGE